MTQRLLATPVTAAVLLTVMAGAGCGAPAEPTEYVVPVFLQAAHGEFGTHMQGRNEVPAHETTATGQLVLRMLADGSGLRYKLLAANIEDVLMSHIHMGAPGVAGPVVVWLYPSAPPAVLIPGRTDGVVAEGIITDGQVIGPLAGQGVAGLLSAINSGLAYANIHNLEFPPGAIRGQLE